MPGAGVHLPHLPVGVVPDRREVGLAAQQELALGDRGLVEGHVGQRHVLDAVLEQPLVVADRVERVLVEDRVAIHVELALPATRQRHDGGDVGRLVVPFGERDLDATDDVGLVLQEADERLVVRGFGGRVAVGREDGVERRHPLPQQQDRQGQGQQAPPRSDGDEQRTEDVHPEPAHVPAQRVRRDERGHAHEQVEEHADPQHRLLAGDEREGEHVDADHEGERAGPEREHPALGEQERAGDQRHRWRGRRRSPARRARRARLAAARATRPTPAPGTRRRPGWPARWRRSARRPATSGSGGRPARRRARARGPWRTRGVRRPRS